MLINLINTSFNKKREKQEEKHKKKKDLKSKTSMITLLIWLEKSCIFYFGYCLLFFFILLDSTRQNFSKINNNIIIEVSVEL